MPNVFSLTWSDIDRRPRYVDVLAQHGFALTMSEAYGQLQDDEIAVCVEAGSRRDCARPASRMPHVSCRDAAY